jgi:hypothetical protein
MARGSNRGIIIGLLVLVAIALVIKMYGAPDLRHVPRDARTRRRTVVQWLAHLAADLRQAVRAIRRAPGVAPS